MTVALRRIVAASPHAVSDSGIRQLVLAYRAKGSHGTVEENWTPKEGFVYASVRAISNRINQNFDAWPSGELKKSAHTFVGKPIFVNHQNFDPTRARGKVIAARYIEARDDKYIETIMEVDAQRFPKLAKEIREGGLDSVSMGVEAGLTICSACGNKATDEPEFCDHVRNHKGKTIRVKDASTGKTRDQLVYEDCYKLGFFELSWVFDPADETAVTNRVMVANVSGLQRALNKKAYGETKVPEDIDTLRDDENDSLDDYQFVEPVDLDTDNTSPFQHYLESPPELSGPNFDNVKQFDRQQEAEGLDGDRLVENFGDIEGDPDFEEAPPRRKTMGRTRTADENEAIEDLEEALEEDLDGDGEEGEDPDHQDAVFGDDDSDDESDDDESAEDPEDSDDSDDAPPWADERSARRRPARTRRRAGKRGQKQKGSAMSLADRAKVANRGRRQHFADTSGHTDGGPYGRNDEGEHEEDFITPVPDAEAVEAPTGDESKITNTENNLVARRAALQRRIQARGADLQQDIRALQTLNAREANARRPYRQTAAFVAAMPIEQRAAAAQHFAQAFKTENPKFSPRKFFAAVGLRVADAVETPDKVDPPLSGTNDQSVKGDDFDDVALDDVETQPKDASKKYFAAFDSWVRSATGRTAAQHNPQWLRRQAARWAQSQGIDVQVLYPSLGNALRQARRGDSSTRKAAMNRRTANESLEVAAPDARIDVEAPVKDDTDADAQSSQYDLSDFAHNAGDDIADPDLDADSQIWAPGEGEKSANKKAGGVAAVRYAEAYINSGLAPEGDRWKLARQAETMRESVVVDRTNLLERVVTANSSRGQKVSAAATRGPAIPRNLTAPGRVASTHRVAANDQSNDSALFY